MKKLEEQRSRRVERKGKVKRKGNRNYGDDEGKELSVRKGEEDK